ncbi:MAG: hypothetical protein OXD44_05005 [Gammaproteobacteria bacterium]|nr:hypothetical protein [Gammaproteobacteria bacterium]MCY4227848.1 hypothetical protein [Gammaproteobacteria bacterium]MCY4313046.1 hypothetical protein [Gammaproteobacteria bacterium]
MSDEQRAMLHALSVSQTAPIREVHRAQVLLHHEGELPLEELRQADAR